MQMPVPAVPLQISLPAVPHPNTTLAPLASAVLPATSSTIAESLNAMKAITNTAGKIATDCFSMIQVVAVLKYSSPTTCP